MTLKESGLLVLQSRPCGRQGNSLPKDGPIRTLGPVSATLCDRQGGRRVTVRQLTCWQKQGTERKICRWHSAGLEAGGRGLSAEESRWPLAAGKGRAADAPWSVCKERSPADPW